MAKPLPTDYFPGFEYVTAGNAVTADSIVIPMSALPALSAAEANAGTGAAHEVLRSILEAAYANYTAIPGDDKSPNQVLSKGTATPIGENQLRQTISVQSTTTYNSNGTEISISPEPA